MINTPHAPASQEESAEKNNYHRFPKDHSLIQPDTFIPCTLAIATNDDGMQAVGEGKRYWLNQSLGTDNEFHVSIMLVKIIVSERFYERVREAVSLIDPKKNTSLFHLDRPSVDSGLYTIREIMTGTIPSLPPHDVQCPEQLDEPDSE